MSATGIGAAVRRKEDQRFITAKAATRPISIGRVRLCYFVRSPHAHAKIKKIDIKVAL